jgi:probable HAF family extracellular repeat protein
MLFPSCAQLHVNVINLRIKVFRFGVLAFFATAVSGQGQSYSFTKIGQIGYNAAEGGYNLGMNDLGTVVGTNSAGHAFVYINGVMTDLGTMDGGTSGASGINNEGIIVGSGSVSTGGYSAFIYTHGVMSLLSTPALDTIAAYAVNDAGVITGGATTAIATRYNVPLGYDAFSYGNGTFTDLGALSGGQGTGMAINASGIIVGSSQVAFDGVLNQGFFHAFVYSDGAMTDITAPGMSIEIAHGINDSGSVVGEMGVQNPLRQAFVYSIGTGITTGLGSLNGVSGYSVAYGINNSGVVVGSTADPSEVDAFVFTNNVMMDLNTLIDAPGIHLWAAYAINNLGQILATDGNNTAYILTPIQVTSPARLINISTRAQVGIGGNILIPGFVISGNGAETLLIRGDGPSLTQFGVTGVLEQPTLSVLDSSQHMIASNTGWGTNVNPLQIAGIAARVGAFAFTANSADCALIVSLPAGSYTVQISGVNSTTGVALAEVYEVATAGTRLVNISTRAQVGTGGGILIPGFVIGGSGSEQLLARADGPSLTQFNVPGVIAQPSLALFDSAATKIASNTGWETSANPTEITSVGSNVGAFALTPGSLDSAQVINLTPGAYTMQVSGANNSTGVALAEIYEVPGNF